MRGLTLNAEEMAATGALLASLKSEVPIQERDAINRWDRLDNVTTRVRRPLYFYLAAAVIFLATVIFGGTQIRSRLRASDLQQALKPSADTWKNRLLLGIGKPNLTHEQTAKLLSDLEPTNPAYFNLYTTVFQDNHDFVPVDFWRTVGLIDPLNPEFLYQEAAPRDIHKRPLHALLRLHQARALAPRRTYRLDLLREKIPLLRQGSLKELLVSRSLLASQREPGANLDRLFSVIDGHMRSYSTAKDVPGFLLFKEDIDAFLRNLATGETPDIDTTSRWISAITPCLSNLHAAAVRLHLPNEAAELDARRNAFQRFLTLKSGVSRKTFTIDGVEAARKMGSLNQELIDLQNLLTAPPPLTDSDVLPMRMIDHETGCQSTTVSLWAATAVCSLLAMLYRFRCPRLVRLLSVRLTKVLQPVDWLWLALTGLLPWIYTMLILRLTPWGGIAFNFGSNQVELPFGESIHLTLAQFMGTTLMMVILPILTARWRLAGRLGFLGFADSARYALAAIATLCAAVFIPLVGWAFLRKSEAWLIVSAVVLAVPLMWVIGCVLRSLTTNFQLIRMATVSQVVIPGYVAALTALLLTVPYFDAARHHWFLRDTLLHMDPAFPAKSKYEYLLDVQAQKEIREALGY